ncbi:FixH family protein [Paenibacillus sp. J5C_2022]|uniref:FixH family protein n=1 Tax=Paenibacillus sp. J5C2022 TaxID=2977129 RepID=UPI0021D07F62|nr:FixH family protein [Paenibacillus sp. J5C2022]MCU6712507.1 FixH family protein [Paenibacillus sp. J5C2022]
MRRLGECRCTSRWIWLLGAVAAVVMLGGCTAKVAPADENGLPPHFSVELVLPQQIVAGEQGRYSVEVSKDGKPVEGVDEAEFVFWLEGDREKAVAVRAEETAPGVYRALHTIEQDGLYVVQSRVEMKDGLLVPAKHLAVGAEAVNSLAHLQEAMQLGSEAAQEEGGGGHHDH